MSAEEMDPDEDRELMGPEGEGEDDSDRDSGNEEEPPTEDEAAAAAAAAQLFNAPIAALPGGDPLVLMADEDESSDQEDPPLEMVNNGPPEVAGAAGGAAEAAVNVQVHPDWRVFGQNMDQNRPVSGPSFLSPAFLPCSPHPTATHPFHSATNRHIKVESLSERLKLLSFHRPQSCSVAMGAGKASFSDLSTDTSSGLPPEIWLYVFSFLDDISLYAVGNVCRRWQHMLRGKVTADQWKSFTRRRWPLFRPLALVKDWFATYSALVESCFCLTCIYQMAEVIPADFEPLALREKRLGHDLRGMLTDPPEGTVVF
jgi:hypothetical protein